MKISSNIKADQISGKSISAKLFTKNVFIETAQCIPKKKTDVIFWFLWYVLNVGLIYYKQIPRKVFPKYFTS